MRKSQSRNVRCKWREEGNDGGCWMLAFRSSVRVLYPTRDADVTTVGRGSDRQGVLRSFVSLHPLIPLHRSSTVSSQPYPNEMQLKKRLNTSD
jgi:hypothetical protein